MSREPKRLTVLPSNEFTDGELELDGPSRRSFIKYMGASLALAGLTGCKRPAEHIIPYGRAPEEVVPGRPQRFASAMSFGTPAPVS